MKRRRLRRILLSLGVFLLCLLVFDLGFFSASLRTEALPDEMVPRVDMIVVLTGGQKRLKDAVRFLEQGRGQYLFVSGTGPEISLDSILKANGLESLPTFLRERILLGDDSRSTVENSVEIRNVMVKMKAQSILLVTSNYHMRRSVQLLRAELSREPIVEARVYPYPVTSKNFAPGQWWKSFVGWQIFFSEYVKSLPFRFLW